MAQQNDDIMDDGAAGGNAVRVEPGVEGDYQDEKGQMYRAKCLANMQ